MKIHVLYAPDGRIVAAVHLDSPEASRLRPVPGPGHRAADFEVPEQHAHLGFEGVCRHLVVDLTGPDHVLIPRP